MKGRWSAINNKEINDLKSIISNLKVSEGEIENLKQEIRDKGLDKEVSEFEKKYGSQVQSFINQLDANGGMSTEEKAKMVMDLQEKMSPEQQKQFKTAITTIKNYLKKR